MAPLPLILDFFFASRQASSRVEKRSAQSVARDVVSTVTSSLKADRPVQLQQRDAAPTTHGGQGITAPENFSGAGMLALFAILAAGMVLASLWFFLVAKNGGFKWREGDWDDYKSTVLRRKGPDGKTLSNATKSTKLGGGTIAGSQHYKWQQSVARSVVGYDEKGRKGIRAKRGWGNSHSVTYSDDRLTQSLGTQTVSDMTEVRTEYDPGEGHHSKRYHDRDMQDYKREKPARVGGMNRVADGSHYDYSQTGSDLTSRSDLMSEAMTESSEQPMLKKDTKKDKQRQAEKDKERSERKAREQAAKMERRWKRDAEQQAASMATYSEIGSEDVDVRPPPSVATTYTTNRKSAAPSLRPANRKLRRDTSPKKVPPPPSSHAPTSTSRDFSYTTGDASEVLSTIYSEGTGTRAPSYYDEYRPRATEHHPSRISMEHQHQQHHHHQQQHHDNRSRQSSPRKKPSSSNRYQGAGYRRGGTDSDLE